MSEENKDNLVHGFEIDEGDHYHVLDFMRKHMNEEQVGKMVHVAKGGHGFPFMATHEGHKLGDYKLVSEGGHLKIIHDHH